MKWLCAQFCTNGTETHREDMTAYLLIQGDVDREAKGVLELDLGGEKLADLFGGRC